MYQTPRNVKTPAVTRRGTFAAGWNAHCTRRSLPPNATADEQLGYAEAKRYGATSGDAYNRLEAAE